VTQSEGVLERDSGENIWTEGWRIVHSEELLNLYISLNMTEMMKSRRM